MLPGNHMPGGPGFVARWMDRHPYTMGVLRAGYGIYQGANAIGYGNLATAGYYSYYGSPSNNGTAAMESSTKMRRIDMGSAVSYKRKHHDPAANYPEIVKRNKIVNLPLPDLTRPVSKKVLKKKKYGRTRFRKYNLKPKNKRKKMYKK